MKLPRIMIAAHASGSGKTLVTCGLLQALKNKGMNAASFKCGPDYIDPLLHQQIFNRASKNLDSFFTDENTTRYLFGREAIKADISVLEGVMGFYDGIGGVNLNASTYEIAKITKTPVILVVNTKGMSLSVIALIKGFMEYKSDSNIKGVILNQMSAMLYPRIKAEIENSLPIKVFGYVERSEHFVFPSRHLGLMLPDELSDTHSKINRLADKLTETVDLDDLIDLANNAIDIKWKEPEVKVIKKRKTPVCIGIAKDEAFCFMYQDNLMLLEKIGAKLIYFSPIHDKELPLELDGLILYGGYPEIYARQLSENESMRKSIKGRIEGGIPYLAECGGFLYLHTVMEDLKHQEYFMTDVIQGKAIYTGKLKRFGYISIEESQDEAKIMGGKSIRGHEFHYFDSTSNGEDFIARKPLSDLEYLCGHKDNSHVSGFPHLYYYSNPEFPYSFIKACAKWKNEVKNVTNRDIKKNTSN